MKDAENSNVIEIDFNADEHLKRMSSISGYGSRPRIRRIHLHYYANGIKRAFEYERAAYGEEVSSSESAKAGAGRAVS